MKKVTNSNWKMEFPKMSWEKPIEEEILDFCLHMAGNFRQAESAHRKTSWFSNNSFSDKCKVVAMAYEKVAEHIKEEIRLRKQLKVK